MFKNECSYQIKHFQYDGYTRRQISNVHYHLVLPCVLSQFVIIIALCNTCRNL